MLKFPRSTYYEALVPVPSNKQLKYEAFSKPVKGRHNEPKGIYGAVKICRTLNEEGIPCSMKRDFTAETVYQKWCTDITWIHVIKEGWTYLASVMDLCSRKIIGCAYGSSKKESFSTATSEANIQARNSRDI